jgi:hypothetical protein
MWLPPGSKVLSNRKLTVSPFRLAVNRFDKKDFLGVLCVFAVQDLNNIAFNVTPFNQNLTASLIIDY